ncbi:MAG: M36 family metallopeptidase [Actinobacteria bacterium]|nr:M36 family metallopeptidase [Actinomycetota bacterium]
MRLRLAVPAVVLGLAAATLPATAGSGTSVDFRSASVVRGDLGSATGTGWALKALQARFDVSGARVEHVRESVVGTHVRGREFRGGVPVQGSDWVVSAVNGRVVQVEAHHVVTPGTPAAKPVGEAVAKAAALSRLDVVSLLAPAAVTRVLAPEAGRLVDTYRVSVVALNPAEAAVVSVDAATGGVLSISDDARYEDGSALVFDPNPIVTKRDITLRQPLEQQQAVDADLDSADLTAQRKKLPLKDLDPAALSQGRLSGPWVNVIAAGYDANINGANFDLTRSDPRFEGLMTYAHLDRYQRYLQSLGFKGKAGVNAEAQDVVALPVQGYDNSFYSPGNDLMLLGAGGVDDGEDAQVTLHEYGHAVQDAQVPDYGQTAEGGAMGEGFGDFQAGAYYARTSGGFQDVCLMAWDSTSYADGPQTCIRRMDSPKVYPKDIKDEVHADGEIWSTFLWQVRAGLPGGAVQKSDNALKLVITMHEFLTPQAKFGDAVASLRTAAKALKHPEWAKVIDRAATSRGLPLNP